MSALLLAAATPLFAQSSTLTLDFGGARMRFADTMSATTLSLSPGLRVTGRRSSLTAAASFTEIEGSTTSSASVDGSHTPWARGPFAAELQAVGGGSRHSDGSHTAQMMALARMHAAADGRGVWAGGGIGRATDGTWRSVLRGDAGAWLTRGAASASITVAPIVVDDSIRYTDLSVDGQHQRDPWELTASLGMRAGNQLPTLPENQKVWGSVAAVFWMSPSLGLVASAGTYPVDFTQGFPGGRFLSVSLRLRHAPAALASVVATALASQEIRAFDAVREAAGRYRIRVRAPSASSVEVAGDFTSWETLPLAQTAGGWWVVEVPISAGTHEVAVRVNRGAWQAPPGLVQMTDEFGGVAGLLVIRE